MAGDSWYAKIDTVVFDAMFDYAHDDSLDESPAPMPEVVRLVREAVSSPDAVAILKSRLGPISSDRHLAEVLGQIVDVLLKPEEGA